MINIDAQGPQHRITPAGLRGDHPVTVLEELALEPGRHELRVVFEPVDPEAPADPLVLEGVVERTAGQVVLVTPDDREGRLRTTGSGR